MTEDDLLQAIVEKPEEASITWLVLADLLEERGDPRAELVRLRHDAHFRADLSLAQKEERVRQLLCAGVQPCMPQRVLAAGMRMVWIPAGTFRMGSPEDEEGRHGNEGPLHEVEITRPFWMSVFPVTVAQFAEFAATGYRTDAERFGRAWTWNGTDWEHTTGGNWRNPGFEQADDCPVTCVTWNDARAFCHWLFECDPRHYYRLPTEAEWEYACRSGAPVSSPFSFGSALAADLANCDGETPYGGVPPGPFLARTTPVGSYPPNAWGLFDMHGNVYEWCHDEYQADYYAASPRQDPARPMNGMEWVIWFDRNVLGKAPVPPSPEQDGFQIVRGGCWSSDGVNCRSASRDGLSSAQPHAATGFRVVALPRP
jgi:uncharacterized protein (TIGR02996 family)